VLFLDRRNDVAFVVENKLIVLIEHQSTPCENMPIRLLIYIARVFEKLFNVDLKLREAVYKTKLQKLPKPEFYVLYNGEAEFPERKELKLSAAFQDEDDYPLGDAPEWLGVRNPLGGPRPLGGFLELTVPVYNINEGHNQEIAKKSETLSGYATFIGLVRRDVKSGYELGKAIEQAVKECVERNILAEFLLASASEVVNMLTLEFKMEEAVQVWKKEGIEEGIEKALKKVLKRASKKASKKANSRQRERC
jgi:hypothetical protein